MSRMKEAGAKTEILIILQILKIRVETNEQKN